MSMVPHKVQAKHLREIDTAEMCYHVKADCFFCAGFPHQLRQTNAFH